MTISAQGYRGDAGTERGERSTVEAMLPIVWINGERQREDAAAHVSARDRGLTLADGVFETMHVRRGTVFRLDGHMARLERGLAALEIPPVRELAGWLLAAVHDAAVGDSSIRLTVTRGIGVAGLVPPAGIRPTVIIIAGPLPPVPASIHDVGLTAHLASGRRNERAMTAGFKTLAYTDAVAGLLEARRAGADEALFLDTEGHCSEASASNLFACAGDLLLTPPLSCGALPGITRAAVLEIAETLGVHAVERALGLEELLAADEAFLTSSLRGVAPLVGVGPHRIGPGIPGTRTRRFAAAYSALVDRECGT